MTVGYMVMENTSGSEAAFPSSENIAILAGLSDISPPYLRFRASPMKLAVKGKHISEAQRNCADSLLL